MPRGVSAPIGTERTTSNGYINVKTERGWRFKHHLLAEELLGRPLLDEERVEFIDGDRRNIRLDNIIVRSNFEQLLEKRIRLIQRIANMQRELEALTSRIEERKRIRDEL